MRAQHWSWPGKGPPPRQDCLLHPGGGHNASAKVFSCHLAPSPSAHCSSISKPSPLNSVSSLWPRITAVSAHGGQEESFWFEFSRRKGLGQQHCSPAQRTAMRHQAAHEVGYSDPSPLREKDACVRRGCGRRDKGFCCSACKCGGDENPLSFLF